MSAFLSSPDGHDADPIQPDLFSTFSPILQQYYTTQAEDAPTPTPTPDPAEGERLKAEAFAKLEANAPNFLDWARTQARRIATEQGRVTSDDLHAAADRDGIAPHHPNAWGRIFNGTGLKRIGYEPSKRPEAHARVISVWAWPEGGEV